MNNIKNKMSPGPKHTRDRIRECRVFTEEHRHNISKGQKKRGQKRREALGITKELLKSMYWEQGLSCNRIGEKLNTSREVIAYSMDFFNIPKRTLLQVAGIADRINSLGITKELLNSLYWEQNLTVKEIGEKFDVGGWIIAGYMKFFKISKRTKRQALRNYHQTDKKVYKTTNEIRNFSPKDIERFRRDMNDPIESEKSTKAHYFPVSKEELFDLYWIKLMSTSQISSELGVSYNIIRNKLKIYNIRRRTISESKLGMYCGKPTLKIKKYYCYKYSPECRETCRDKWYRRCVLCGELEGERAHSTHHIDHNKEAGCDETVLRLVPLCNKCHAKTNGSDVNIKKWQNILSHLYILREQIDEVGRDKFDYRSIFELGSLDTREKVRRYSYYLFF